MFVAACGDSAGGNDKAGGGDAGHAVHAGGSSAADGHAPKGDGDGTSGKGGTAGTRAGSGGKGGLPVSGTGDGNPDPKDPNDEPTDPGDEPNDPGDEPNDPSDEPSDAGEMDSGIADAGRADSGAPDAGEADSGAADSGIPDSGDDAGTPDSGTHECDDAIDCDDGVFCNGPERCDMDTHECHAGTPPECDDGNLCTMDTCGGASDACVHDLIDVDGDGHASSNLGACGDDCDDVKDSVHPGAPETCDDVDSNCDGVVDTDLMTTWYMDCDSDGYAATGALTSQACSLPSSHPCAGKGGWTGTSPATSADCQDSLSTVHPGANEIVGDEIDENCDTHEVCFADADDDSYVFDALSRIASDDVDCQDKGEAKKTAPFGDCCDHDDRAYPGQSGYFTDERKQCGGYDFDCSGTPEPHFTTTGGSCSAKCVLTVGWGRDGAPDCGDSAAYWGDGSGSICAGIGTCTATAGTRTQECH